jgi:hypothetical protein
MRKSGGIKAPFVRLGYRTLAGRRAAGVILLSIRAAAPQLGWVKSVS